MPQKRTKIERACLTCGALLLISSTNRRFLRRKYCSLSCSARSQAMTPEQFWACGARNETGCLVWTKARLAWGYGSFRLDCRPWTAHRYAWTLTYGPIPDGLWVLHKCDNPPCFEPSHLFLGTVADNSADMAAKGRQWLQDPSRVVRGEARFNSILTEEKVLEIRRLREVGHTLKQIAAMYRVHLGTIWQIVNRKTWTHI